MTSSLIESIYPCLLDNLESNSYFNDKVILAPRLETLSEINNSMCSLLPGEEFEF